MRMGRVWMALLLIGVAMPARADDCLPAPGVSVAAGQFIETVGNLQRQGSGTLPIGAALFGFQGISDANQQALAQRPPVQVTKQSDQGGSFANRGPKHLHIDGVFAGRATFFDIPKAVAGSYAVTAESVTLTYDPAHAVKVGETFLGVKFSKTINHSVVTRQRLDYYFDSNASGPPDRCYDLTAQ